GHIKHRAFSRIHPRLTQNLKAIANSFDTGVGAAAEAVSVEENGEGGPDPDPVNVADGFLNRLRDDERQVPQLCSYTQADRRGVHKDKKEKYRQQELHGLFGAAEVEKNQPKN